jgi:deoxyribodipyrimidine photo-lyase
MTRALVLFARDLRVRDQPALAAAAREADTIVPTFVLDSKLLAGSCATANRLAFLLDSLRDLDSSLRTRGGQLVLCQGDVVEQALRLVRRWKLSAIYMSADVTPYARARELRLAQACERERVELRTFHGVTVQPAGELTPKGGDHYRVFTPYWRAWSQAGTRSVLSAPRRITTPHGLPTTPPPSLHTLTRERVSPDLPAGGESAGRKLLERWLRRGLADYDTLRDALARDATSGLSPYLHFGCLSASTVLARSAGHAHADSFTRQLCWRDFHHQVLAARPDMPHADYRPRGNHWRQDPQAADAWRSGLTGYPIVDAGMRQLAREGVMHNRARLIVASFLTKTLHLDWRLGAAHFARLLVDADVANNVGNWQWVAGTGNDTRPNRVLNPLRQAKRFDPHGEYVRRYVPELADIAGSAVHEPWRLTPRQRQALHYPAPLVVHSAAGTQLRTQPES